MLTGSPTDPIAFRHLNEVRDFNELFTRAKSGSRERQLLDDIGLGFLSERSLQIERMQYSDLASIKLSKDQVGFSYAREALDSVDGGPLIYVVDPTDPTSVSRTKLKSVNSSLYQPEELSTIGYFSSRDNSATAFRYRITDADGETVYLTQRQVETLRVRLGGGTVDQKSLLKNVSKVWKVDDTTGALNMEQFDPLGVLGSFFQKMDKRLTASTSDRKYVDDNVKGLIERINKQLEIGNPELYQRLKAADALPKNLEDVFMKSSTSTSRLFDAISLSEGGDKTILQDIAEKSARSVQEFENLHGIILGQPVADSLKGEYAGLLREQRQAEFNLAQVRSFGQQSDLVSKNTLLTNFGYYNQEASIPQLEKIAREYYQSAGSKASMGGLIDHLQKAVDNGVISGDQQRMFSSILDNWEKAYDGSGVLSDYAIKSKALDSLSEIKKLNAAIDAGDVSSLTSQYGDDITLDMAKQMRGQLVKELEPFSFRVMTYGEDGQATGMKKIDFKNISQAQIDQVLDNSSIDRLDDVTARVLIGTGGQVKTVLDVRTADEMLQRFGVIGYGSEELFKGETPFGRFTFPGEDFIRGQAITMEPLSHFGEERVYSDVQANIFHSSYMKRKTMLDMMKANQQDWADEINEMIDSGVVPQRLMKRFEQQSRLDVSMWEEYGFQSRKIAEQYRDDAIELMNLIRSGAKPSQIPELANKIMKQSHKSVVRQGTKAGGKVNVFQPVMPMAQRQSVDTEGVVATRNAPSAERSYSIPEALGTEPDPEDITRTMRNDPRRLLGKNAYKDVDVMLGNNETRAMRLLRYRSDGHKMITPDIAAMGRAGVLYSAAGGFDLDDKFITDLSYITDSSGSRRLATFAFRQPTGPQEYAVLMPQLDEETLTRMMGSEDRAGNLFRSSLRDFGSQIDTNLGIHLTNKNKYMFAGILRESGISDEERVIKYLEAISLGKKDIAQYYYGGAKSGFSALTEEQIEQGFFNLADREAGRSMVPGSLSTYGQGGRFSRQSDKVARFNLGAIDDTTLGRTAEIFQDEIGRSVYGSSSLQLSVSEIMSDKNLSPSYRNSMMMNIHEASITMESDPVFAKRMTDLYQKNKTFFDGTDMPINVRQSIEAGDDLSEFMVLRYALEGPDNIKEKVLVEMAEMKMRLAEKASAKATPFALSGYINTLGFARSTDDQFQDIVERIGQMENGDAILKFLNQPYLGYNPEGSIDFSIGGGGRQVLTQFHQDILDQYNAFNRAAEFGGMPLDQEKSFYKSLYQLYRVGTETDKKTGYLDDVSKGMYREMDLYGGLDDFIQALNDPIRSKGIKESITAELEIVRKNILVQEGEKMGKLRALFYSGLISPEDANRLGIDAFTASFKLANADDQILYAQGAAMGVRNAITQFTDQMSEEALGSATGYRDFLDKHIAFASKKGKGSAAVRKKGIKELFSNVRYGFNLQGQAAETYSLDAVQKLGEKMVEEAFALKTKIKPDSAVISTLLDRNIELQLDNIAGSFSRDLRAMIANDSADYMEYFNDSYKSLKELGRGEMSGAARSNVAKFIAEKMNNVELSQTIEASGILGEPGKLAYAKQLLEARMSIAAEEASTGVYGQIMGALESTDNPVDLKRLMGRLYVDISKAQLSDNETEAKAANFLENILTTKGDFFEREGRVRLDLAYAQARRGVLRSEKDEFIIKSQQKLQQFIEAFDPRGSAIAGENVDRIERLRRFLRPSGVMNLFDQTYFDESDLDYPTISGVDPSYGAYAAPFSEETSRTLPSIATREGLDLRTAIERNLGPDATPERVQALEDIITMQMMSKDENVAQTTNELIRQRKIQEILQSRGIAEGVDVPKEISDEADRYMNTLRSVINLDDSMSAADDAEALSLFDRFKTDLDTRTKSPTSILDELYPAGPTNPAADAADDLMRSVLNPSDVPYRRITDKFPAINDMLSTVSRNKSKFIIGAAALASGAYLYSKNKNTDVSADSVSGPPLLPGGSPYEMPPTEIVQYPNFSGTNNSEGLGESYELQMAGSQDQVQRFLQMAQSTGQNTNANVYSAIRNAGADPYL